MNRRLLAVGVLMALLAYACGTGDETEGKSSAFSGSLSWITPDELAVKLEDGPATVVNFWASWCGPCRSEAPVLRRAFEEYGVEVRFIGVAIDDTADGAFDFIDTYGIPFENYLADGGPMMAAYETFGIPFTVFTDAAGEVLNVHRGIIDEQVLGLWTDELSRLG